MKLTSKKYNELSALMDNRPTNVEWEEQTDKDVEMFFEWSERGAHKEIAKINTYLPEGRTGFHALIWAKKWREIKNDPNNGLILY